jgi:hypothetical protein
MARTHGETPTWIAYEFLSETGDVDVKVSKRRRWLVPAFFIVIVGWAIVGSFMDMPGRLLFILFGMLFAAFTGSTVLSRRDDDRSNDREQ